jgi:Uncharacterised protein family (UPF0182)
MSRRGRRLVAAIGAVVALLFAGRWTATLLADRWWAAQLSPGAAAFITDWHLLRLTLDLSGCLIASAWFIGHLLLVYRAVGTVQVRRNVANLEFREALTPRALLTFVVITGVLLGLVVGAGVSGWWREVTLAWQGVSYGISDPLLGRDIGLYLAQFPIWRAAHGFFVLLVLLALSGVTALYMLVGAIRWIERRPAINHHARAHIGWLLAALALALAWGYLLEPYELIAGPADLLDRSTWHSSLLVSPTLAGVALAAGALSAVWAARPRHALVVSIWIVLLLASMAGHWLVPALLSGSTEPAVEPRALERLARVAYGLETLRDTRLERLRSPAPPAVPSLWNPAALVRVFPGDSSHLLAVNPAVLTPDGKRRPVWLVVRSGAQGRVIASAVADHRVSRTGEPLFYRLVDTVPHPTPVALLDLPSDLLGPEARDYRLTRGDGPGVAVDSWSRRLLLAWALQAGELLADGGRDRRVDWHLAPEDRLSRLAPFADWGLPVARVIEGELVWLVDGYLASGSFPLTNRVPWRDRRAGSVRAAFLGTVNAESGAVRVYLQPGADPLAATWSRLSNGLVEPASSIPEPVLRAAPYPGDWFRIQAQQLERVPWKAGNVSGPPSHGPDEELPPPQVGWSADTTGPLAVTTFELPGERRLSAVLIGSRDDGRAHLTLVRLDSTATLPVRGVLESRWANFPSYDALNDSIREDGGKLERGPLRVEVGPGGPVAYQGYFALRPAGGTVLAWVSVAAPNRLGAGRTLKEAWSNLLGASVPAPPGSAQSGRLDEARRWMQHADSALRIGDWTEFGRAWSNLRNILGLPLDSTRF